MLSLERPIDQSVHGYRQENVNYMSSQSVKQTPSLVFGSVDVDFDFKMETISPKIFSPDLRDNSETVRPAV